MGKVLQEKFIEVGDLIPGLTGEQKWTILQALGNVDDDTWEHFDEERNRQNRIGSHMFKSRNTLAKEQGTRRTTMERWFKKWCEMGLWADARDVPGLENDRTYNSYYSHVPKDQRTTHFVFNVTWMCNLLDLRASMKSHRVSDVKDERVQTLAKIALSEPEESMRYPRTTSFLKDFKPRILESLDLDDDPPESWEDLFPEKENSARAGAVQKVKKDNLTKGTGNPEEGLSVTDHNITKDEFANLLEEIFPKVFFYTHNGKEESVTFSPEHIDDYGRLQLRKAGLTKMEIVSFNESPAGKELQHYNDWRKEDFLQIRRYLDMQRE